MTACATRSTRKYLVFRSCASVDSHPVAVPPAAMAPVLGAEVAVAIQPTAPPVTEDRRL